MVEKAIQLGLTCLAAFLLLAAEHWFCTWRPALRGKIKPPWTYVAGVLSLMLPWAALMACWGYGEAILSFLAVAVFGGLAVAGGYHLLGLRFLKNENRLLKKHLEREDDGDKGQR